MIRLLIVAAGLVTFMVASASAQEWPAKPIRVIVPIGVGSGPDIVPRIVLDRVGQQIGQTFVFENRPGAGTTTGTAAVARAEADGYTLLATSSSIATAPSLYQNMPYNTTKDLAGIAQFGALPMTLIVNPDAPFKSVAELVAFAKAGQRPLNFATTGVGSSPHFAAERFRISAGFQAAQVPFKSSAESMTEIVAGRIDYCFCPVGNSIELIRSGKLRSLAVSTQNRVQAMADVPTTTELGFKNSDYDPWVGLLAPRGTPRPIMERLAREIGLAMKEPNVASRLTPNGILPTDLTLDAFDALIAKEIEVNAEIAKSISLRPS